jgi:hypothetical protein
MVLTPAVCGCCPIPPCRKPGSNADPEGTNAILNCSDTLYTQQTAGYFNSLQAPAMYAPGDNEWTDCDRSNSAGGPFNSLNRLSFIRKTFFNDEYSQGQRKLKQEVQRDTCLGWGGNNATNITNPPVYKNEACVENRR